MIGYGCTAAPYYDSHPACPGGQGFHHGIDIALPCGTRLRAGAEGMVVHPSAPGTPGSAYGERPFRVRVGGHDILIGHAGAVFVRSGDRIRPGDLVARASDSGAPDGCHLHFEVRPAGGGYTSAIDPMRWLQLTPAP